MKIAREAAREMGMELKVSNFRKTFYYSVEEPSSFFNHLTKPFELEIVYHQSEDEKIIVQIEIDPTDPDLAIKDRIERQLALQLGHRSERK